jgi:hypothetical protein
LLFFLPSRADLQPGNARVFDLKAYQYFPMLIPQSPSMIPIAGNLFSQLFISATALLIAVYNLKFIWFIVIRGHHSAIEEWFKKSGIYSRTGTALDDRSGPSADLTGLVRKYT